MYSENPKKTGCIEVICGSMFSGKTEELIRRIKRAQFANQKIRIFKPAVDVRYSDMDVVSHDLHSIPCSPIKEAKAMLDIPEDVQVVGVDEAQFLTREQVEQLKEVSRYVPVLCYGLLTNFKTELFEGSKRLVEISDSLLELKSICRCGRKANINARFDNGKLVTDGSEIQLGGNSTYEALCFNCYSKLKQEQQDNNSKQN